jgi:hypothetical protein
MPKLPAPSLEGSAAASSPAPARRWSWRSKPVLGFAAALTLLSSVAIGHLVTRERTLVGVPEDPNLDAARRLLDGSLPVGGDGLRFVTALTGEPAGSAPVGSDPRALDRIATAERHVRSALERHPEDVRIQCALAAFDLAAQRYERAERRYRVITDRVPRYGEARLGLGMALALQAGVTGDEIVARRLALRAIAQFAAVDPADATYPVAVYDRAVMLHRVGRPAEARRWAAVYAALDPGSEWPRRLERLVGSPAATRSATER